MKKIPIVITALSVVGASFGAGTLTPSGAPAPTMKTLQQIEPRTPLIEGESGVSIDTNGTISITQSGSYYLTTNLAVSSGDGIRINASGVTLDLNGFTIRSTVATVGNDGINITANRVSIFNGHIESGTVYDSGASGDQYTGSGFESGIFSFSSSNNYLGIRIRNVSISGCDLHGIYLGSGDSLVESCTVEVVGSYGIKAGVVNNCSATTCGGTAISGYQITGCRGTSTSGVGINSLGTVANCYGYTFGTSSHSDGISAQKDVQNSHGYSSGGKGIKSGGTVANSYGQTIGTMTSSDGIYATATVQNCYGYSKGGDGIRAKIVSYSYGRSTGSDSSADGIQANIAIGCVVSGGENITNKYLMP